MAPPFDPTVRAFLEQPNMASIATLDENGAPQAQPSWFDVEGDLIRVNSREGRRWPARLRRDARVSLLIVNAQDPAEYVHICGRAIDFSHDGAEEHINELAHKYIGADHPFSYPGEQRVIIRIQPDELRHVNATASALKAIKKATQTGS